MESVQHQPVMVKEISDLLPLSQDGLFIDGTVGLGGHSLYLAQKLKNSGHMILFDWDENMLKVAKKRLEPFTQLKKTFVHANYNCMTDKVSSILKEQTKIKGAQGILLDLGLNNAQIEDSDRGFSFKNNGPLDMRMNNSEEILSAADLLNKLSVKELEDIIFNFGDERWARKIAHIIVERRKTIPLKTTHDLVDCVLAAIPAAKRDKRIHPATRTFQAIRIAINKELEDLSSTVEQIAHLLCPGGVLAILSYHSGEDRIIKHTFLKLKKVNFDVLFKKPVVPTVQEILENPKSRSAKLRAIRKQMDA